MIPKFNDAISPCDLNSITAPPFTDELKNSQGWYIQRRVQETDGQPTFYLKDPYGLSHTAREFILENIDLSFSQALTQASSIEEQQMLVLQYLQDDSIKRRLTKSIFILIITNCLFVLETMG